MTKELSVGDVFATDKLQPPGAQWVVVKTEFTGGGTGHGPHDVYPDGHEVTAKRIGADGNYDPRGKAIQFYQSGCFGGMIPPADVRSVGRMRQTFVWQSKKPVKD